MNQTDAKNVSEKGPERHDPEFAGAQAPAGAQAVPGSPLELPPRRVEPAPEPPLDPNGLAAWLGHALWVGILADWALAIPILFAPEAVLDLLSVRQTHDPVWTAFAVMLVVLRSVFYIPAASLPYKYRFNAWLAVFTRLATALFFLVLWRDSYPALGLLDGALFAVQLPLLLAAMRAAPARQQDAGEHQALQVPQSDHSRQWLSRMIWLGIAADVALGAPAIFVPEQVLAAFGFRATPDPVWAAYASLVLVLLGCFYIPAAIDPYRYRFSAWAAVFARPPGVLFFLLLWRGLYPAFGVMDGVLFLLSYPFLVRAMQVLPVRRSWDTERHDYRGTTYRYVKDATWSGPYAELPRHKGLGLDTMGQLFADAARNMHDKRDIRPHYDKLVHSHGVAYAGIWKIDRESPYTGFFKNGSEGLLIARISVAGPFLHQGARRALGIGGKIFNTRNPDEWVWPANFVVVSNLTGSRAKHVLDIPMTNYLSTGIDPFANLIARVVFRSVDTRPAYRQLFPISTLGLRPGDPIVTPDLMMLKVASGTPRVDAKDFRDEIRLARYPEGKLVFDILVKNFDEREWSRLGAIVLTEDVVSEGSDKRLHFWIPRDIPNLPKTPSASLPAQYPGGEASGAWLRGSR
jgi:hypothetical protein